MNEIKTSEISIIVQGAIDKKETPKCLTSIRKYLPDAEIILSTWKGSDISTIDGLYDILVLNKDPGAVFYEKHSFYHNINRQIVSTKKGLEKAHRKFIMKMRSDLILTSDNFLNYFDKFPNRTEEYKLFEHKVIIPATFTRIKYKKGSIYTPFFISDWWFFGLNQDIKKYFDAIDIVKEPEFSKYFELVSNKKTPLNGYTTRFTPEQYFGLSAFGKEFDDIHMNDLTDVSEELINKSKIAIVNNFIVLEYKQHGIFTNKYLSSKDEKYLGEYYCSLYNNTIYKSEYKRLLDCNYPFDSEKELKLLNSKSYIKKLKLHKYTTMLTDKTIKFSKKLEKIFISIPLTSIDYLICFLRERFNK